MLELGIAALYDRVIEAQVGRLKPPWPKMPTANSAADEVLSAMPRAWGRALVFAAVLGGAGRSATVQ
jgi:hypothetical protein